ncbi:MAG: shikimate kinase [Campylobacterota bacterium]|nr:shikimate kinase [Campylobacterota bacterium]
MRNKNIILIGFMGVGKGTIARALVKKSDYFSVDTDDLIESIENKKIKKIFEEEGEEYFRNLEKKCSQWCKNNLTNTIISTGGGFYKQENIKEIGTIIYLESTFEKILEGLRNAPNSKKKFKKRPLLNDLDKAKEIYNQRVQEYKDIADIVINVEDWDENKAVENILSALSKGN